MLDTLFKSHISPKSTEMLAFSLIYSLSIHLTSWFTTFTVFLKFRLILIRPFITQFSSL